MATVNDVVQAARMLETAKFALEQLRDEKAAAQTKLDDLNVRIPAARQALATARATLTATVAAFEE